MKFNPRIKIEIIKTQKEVHEDIELGVKPKKYLKKQKGTYYPPYFSAESFSKPHSSKRKSYSSMTDYNQTCTVICKYRKTKTEHLKNLEYIQKEGKDMDGGKPDVYGNIPLEEYEKKMVDKSWRIILSPGKFSLNNSQLRTLSESFIEKLEDETGYKFDWVAANHFDTGKHHIHILINGLDQNNHDVNFLPPEKVKRLMREYANYICTSMLGKKTKEQVNAEYKNMPRKNYFTRLDKILKNFIVDDEIDKSYMNHSKSELLGQRLDYLMELQLAEYDKKKQKYKIKKEWEEELRIFGKYNMYNDGFNYAAVSPDKYYLHELKDKGMIEGEILKKYTMQKDSNNFALVIKKDDGSVGYVPLSFYPKDCFVGDRIRIENYDRKTRINNLSRKGNNNS